MSLLFAKEPIRVACVGNSITYGYKLENRETDAYPVVLQKMLGNDYNVQNFGYSGATLLKNGHRPYVEQEAYHDALEFKPDIVIIHLGLNDTDPRNWPNYGREFIFDYLELVKDFQNVGAEEVYICKMTPIFPWHKRFIWSTRDWFWEIQTAIEKVAEIGNLPLIDIHTPLYSRPDLFHDSLHPSAEGASILAKTVYQHMTGNFGGLQLADIFTDNMVIQRDKPIHIWGTAKAGQKITVKFADEKAQSTVGMNGKWSVELPPISSDERYFLEVKSGNEKIHLDNILLGDVWLCSGQSNMDFELQNEQYFTTIKENLYDDKIRLLNMRSDIHTRPKAYTEEQMVQVNRMKFFRKTNWKICNQSSASTFSAVAYYFGKMLQDSLQIPIGLIHNAVGGSPTESWISRKALEHHKKLVYLFDNFESNEMIMPWVRQRAMENIGQSQNSLQQHPYKPGYLYDTGIKPLEGLTFKGVIWYQGESNAHNVLLHETELKVMVQDWRKNLGDFPFYYVQLSSINNRPTWGEFRNSQRLLMTKLPNCGMAVSSDLGHPTDVHPKNKKAIGERLARWALAKDYNFGIVFSGPLYKEMKVNDNAIEIYFDYCGNGLKSADGGKLTGFEIAGNNGKFVKATAEIQNNRIIVSHSSIENPTIVRYGWQPYSKGNLVNSEGLPASTFITEDIKRREGNVR